MTDAALIDIGRVLLATFFIASGVRHFFVFPDVAAAIASRGVPWPKLMLAAGTAFEIVAGLLLALRWFVVPATVGLILFTLAASVMLLDFWNRSGAERVGAINGWLANIAVIGGLLLVIALG